MSLWRKLVRTLERWAIPRLTLILIIGQVAAYLLSFAQPDYAAALELKPHLVPEGQWWRVFTFLVVPSLEHPILFVLGILFFHLMGVTLELHFGDLRYNLFILISYLSSISIAMLLAALSPPDPKLTIPNGFVYTSIFLAFAWLFPNFEILLFFLFPVKVKWLGLITVGLYLWGFVEGLASFRQGGWLICLLILAANLNLFVFFGRDLWVRLRSGQRRMTARSQQIRQANRPRHTCVICGATNLSHPEMDFRYCPECHGTPAYCELHLKGHEHMGDAKANK